MEGGLRCVQPSLDEGTYDLAIDSSVGLLAPALRYEVLSSVRIDSLAPSFGYANTSVEVAGLFSDLEAPLTCLFGALEANASLVDALLSCVAPIRRRNASLMIRDAQGRSSEVPGVPTCPSPDPRRVMAEPSKRAGRRLTIDAGVPGHATAACRVDVLYTKLRGWPHLIVCDMLP